MNVKVKHRLSSTGSAIDHRAEVVQPLLFGHARSHQQQVTQQSLILGSSGTQALDRLTGNDQHMHRSLGGDIAKGQALLIAVDLIARDLATKDLPEDRVVCHGPRKGRNSGTGVTAGA